MAKAKTSDAFPSLANATPSYLIDEIKRLRDIQKNAKALEGYLSEGLKARFQDDKGNPTPLTEGNKKEFAGKQFKSDNYVLTVEYVEQNRLDGDALRAAEPEIAAKYVKSIAFNQFKFEALPPPIDATVTEVKP